MNFDAEIVLLSACNTAYGDKNYSEILSGLTSSFFNAGAKSLLVSNWAIDSKTTTDFTSRVFKNLINQKTLNYILANLSFLNFLCPDLPGSLTENKIAALNGSL